MAATGGTTFALTERDRILPIVPMFHANAWGLPYAGWMTGSDFVMPNRFLQGEPLCKLIMAERPTVSGAETYNSGSAGSRAGQHGNRDQGPWKIADGMLHLSQDGSDWTPAKLYTNHSKYWDGSPYL